MTSLSDDDIWDSLPDEEDLDSDLDRRLTSIDSEARKLWVSQILGRRIGPFQVLEQIGEDDTGALFKAFESDRNRLVRLKVLWLKIARHDTAFARFVRAMRTTIDLKHPNIVRLYAAGNDGDYCYTASEHFEALPLSEATETLGTNGMLDWKFVLRVAKDICNGLEMVFEKQILHRNITPKNILLTNDGMAKLSNLILAKAIEGAKDDQISAVGAGEIIGQLVYMAPELAIGDKDEPDWRSDIYSLGATLYSVLTGRPPFQTDAIDKLARMIKEEEPEPPQKYQPEIPDDFQKIILRMLAKDPDDRYTTPAHILRDLNKLELQSA